VWWSTRSGAGFAVRGRSRSSGARRSLPESLRRDPHRAVELARAVLPRDDRGQLDDRVLVVVAAQPLEELVGYLAAGDRHRVRVFQRHALALAIQRARRVVREGGDLL